MLKSEASFSKFKSWAGLAAVSALLFLLAAAPVAAQDFTLTLDNLNPPAVSPGGVTASNVTVTTNTGFSGTINLACTVTPTVQITSSDFPQCTVSPTSLTGSGGASVTVTTVGTTPTIGYDITITGTDASGSQTTPAQTLTVLAQSAQFTVTVQSAVSPSSVVAGSGAQGVITVNPLAGYTTPTNGYITLYCGTITPLVTIAPVCSFDYGNQPGVIINGPTPESATVTIKTYGPITTGAASHSRTFYAFWLGIPILGFVGLGAAVGRKNSRRIWGILALFVVTGSLLLFPSCGNNAAQTTTETPNGVTPANTYTFTIIGVDSNGVVSSNTGSTNSAGPAVTLTVTAPPK